MSNPKDTKKQKSQEIAEHTYQDDEPTEISIPLNLSIQERYGKIDFSGLQSADELVNLDDFVPPVYSGKECIGQTFVLIDYQPMKGDKRDYLLCTVYDPISERIVYLSTGSLLTMPLIQHLVDYNLVPCLITLEAVGRSYKIGKTSK